MKKAIMFLLLFPAFCFSGVFEHLLNQEQNYLFEHNFRCNDSICITSEKNIFDDPIMDSAVKLIKTFLDHEKKVFKVQIELNITAEKKASFYNATIKHSSKTGNTTYSSYVLSDKYGNHELIDIIDKKRKKAYMIYLDNLYYETMKSYKN